MVGRRLYGVYVADPEHGATRVMKFAQHKTAKTMWRSFSTTFGVRTDPVQVYDLEVRTNKLTQGGKSLEDYWVELQNLWVDIDTRKLFPYTCCEKATNIYIKEIETKRLYQFLSGLDDRYDGLRREILKDSHEASAEDPIRDRQTRRNQNGNLETVDPTQRDINRGWVWQQDQQPASKQPSTRQRTTVSATAAAQRDNLPKFSPKSLPPRQIETILLSLWNVKAY